MRISLLFVIAAFSSGSVFATVPSATRKLDLKDLSIVIPADWEVLEDADTLLTARSPQEGPEDSYGENFRLKVHAMPNAMTLDKVLEIQHDDAKGEFNIRGQGKLAGSQVPVAWLAISPKDATIAGGNLTKIDYMLIHGNKLYAMHCMLESSKYDQYQPSFEAIARTIMPISTEPTSKPLFGNKTAHEEGKIVGRIVFYAMLAAIAIWGVIALFRRVGAKR
ncbi:MAG: hypothetical protein K8T91_19565 [Planctomycetes bacterium]|nr:hypothetical protein [Planctomycetota bacterium]